MPAISTPATSKKYSFGQLVERFEAHRGEASRQIKNATQALFSIRTKFAAHIGLDAEHITFVGNELIGETDGSFHVPPDVFLIENSTVWTIMAFPIDGIPVGIKISAAISGNGNIIPKIGINGNPIQGSEEEQQNTFDKICLNMIAGVHQIPLPENIIV